MLRNDHDVRADRIARIERLCSALDEVQEKSKRIRDGIATEARHARRAAMKVLRSRERSAPKPP